MLQGAPRRIRLKAMKYVLIGDDMFYRTLEGLLLKCLGPSCCLCAVMFQSYASSCCIELVAQRQHPTSFKFNRSDLLWFALILGVCVISIRLGLANGLDDLVV